MKMLFRLLVLVVCLASAPLTFVGCGGSYMSEEEAMQQDEDTTAEEEMEAEDE